MTKIIEIKDKVFKFWGEYETYLKYIYKFILALALFCLINSKVGFMESISTFPVALLLAIGCCFLPQGVTLLVAATLIVANLYVLSMEVAITALLIIVLVFFLYFRFSPHDGVLFVLTPLCFALQIPYVLPIATGLFRKIYSIAAVCSATVVYFFIDGIYDNVTALQATTAGAEVVEGAKMTITAGQLLANKEMYFTVLVFAVSAMAVHVIKKIAMDYAWKVAIVSGALIQVSGLFVGYLLFDISGKMLGMVIGNIIAVFLGFVLEFMFMDLDYSRTERVQFEDEDYYYFVKAVPKKMVASADKEVIQFSGFTPLERLKEKRNAKTKSVSRKQIVEELEIEDEFLDLND